MDDWSQFEKALRELMASGNVEVQEDGEWLAELDNPHCEIRRQGNHALIHLWSTERNLVRRVLRVAERSPERLVLEVQCLGRARPGRLEIFRTGSPRLAARVSREQFRARFRRMLAEEFPDARLDSLTTAADLEHSFSGLYSRGVMSEGGRSWAVLGVSEREGASTVEGLLAFGLLWLDWTRQHAERRAVEGLRLFLPEGASEGVLHRREALHPSAHLEVFEFNEKFWKFRRMDSAHAGNLESWLTPRHEVEATMAAARETVERVRGRIPAAGGAIDAVVPPGTREVALRFRGLELARWSEGRLRFGLGDDRRELNDSSWPQLDKLLRTLELCRSPFSGETNHALYRAAPERWLEALVLANPSTLDAQLDPRHLYSQVPAFSAGDRGVMDLLGVTHAGRMVVIELKASEDLQLPMQAMDYWLRVRAHQRSGDFPQHGYFPGIELQPAAPLLWLAAPGLRFHPTTDTLLRYLSSEVQVTRIGLNENWRRGLQVIFRM